MQSNIFYSIVQSVIYSLQLKVKTSINSDLYVEDTIIKTLLTMYPLKFQKTQLFSGNRLKQ